MKLYLTALTGLFIFALLTPQNGFGQQKEYFDGTIIIKYKTDRQLQTIQSQANIDPEEDIRQMLQQAGATSMQPVWSSRNRMQGSQVNAAKIQRAADELQRVYEVRYSSGADAAAFAQKMEQLEGIEYAEPKYIRYSQYSPNDPIENPYRDLHNFEAAWDVTRGSSDVIIAVVDGGVNYLHYDLDAKLWVNTNEVPASIRSQVDQNSNGVITSTEVINYLNDQNGDYNNDGSITLDDALANGSPLLTGSDTDGNGFTDDIFGWDYWASGGVDGQPITQDNNPIADGTDHGAHVAGIATAETDNGDGIAGTGFNVRYMALKAGGISDVPSTPDDESRAIGFGYESIIYAAMQGADVINCSWGGGGFSEFENDVINFATNMGSLVVAASGNAALNSVDYPSGYQNTLSVGSVDDSGAISSFSNIGYNVDVFATGSGIESTGFGDEIVNKSGTSMSTPVVAGLAGLIKSVHPDWSPLRISAQIRSSARFIDSGDSRQGHGVVDAAQAVSTQLPGIKVTDFSFEDSDGDKLGLGESGTVTLSLTNYGSSTSNIILQLQSLVAQGISIDQPAENIGSLATGESINITFAISINEGFDLNIIPTFRLDISGGSQGYEDFDIIQYSDILFDVMDANNVRMSFAGDGTVGFIDAFAQRGGVGFVPLTIDDSDFIEAENALFEGGLMVEANGMVYDVVRGTGSQVNKDFEPEETFAVESSGNGQTGTALFRFGDDVGTAGGEIRLETFAYNEADRSNVVYVKYSLTNTNELQPLKDVYLGLFNDWDIGANISNNDIAYSEQDSILYTSSGNDTADDPIIAVAHLSPISSVLAINNFPTSAPTDPAVDLSDGFGDTEKRAALKAGRARTSVTSADVSAVTASGPYTVNAGATLVAGFVYAYGNELDELRAQVMAAREEIPFQVSKTGLIVSNVIPPETELLQNAPNPFTTDGTFIRMNLNERTDVKLVVYDVLGREVEVLRDGQFEAGEYPIPFNPNNLSSGTYFVRMVTDQTSDTISITYIK